MCLPQTLWSHTLDATRNLVFPCQFRLRDDSHTQYYCLQLTTSDLLFRLSLRLWILSLDVRVACSELLEWCGLLAAAHNNAELQAQASEDSFWSETASEEQAQQLRQLQQLQQLQLLQQSGVCDAQQPTYDQLMLQQQQQQQQGLNPLSGWNPNT